MGILKSLFKKSDPVESGTFCSAVVAAAGSSTRMGENKMFTLIGGAPVLAHTLLALQSFARIDEIVVVARGEDIVPIADLCRDFDIDKATKIVCGGGTRLESVYIGLQETNKKAGFIAVHDGARPFVTEMVFDRALDAALAFNAAAPAVNITSTVKRAENGIVVETLDRSALYILQTPQIFESNLIKAAVSNAFERDLEVTDDCMAVEAIGHKIRLSEGSNENIKITTLTDVAVGEAIITMRSERA